MNQLSVKDLVMNVDATKLVEGDDNQLAVLGLIESSAKARGDLALANRAHYRWRVLKSKGYWWLPKALDFVFYREIAGYLVRPLRPLAILLGLASGLSLIRWGRRIVLRIRILYRLYKRRPNSLSVRPLGVRATVFRALRSCACLLLEAVRLLNEFVDALALIWSRKTPTARSDWGRLGRRLEVVAYRVLMVAVLVGFANSNPSLRQMLEALR